MASAQPIDREQLMKDVWEYITPKIGSITEKQRKEIDDVITECHERVTAITKTLSGVGEGTHTSEVERLLKPYIKEDSLRAIKCAFEEETFTIHIEKTEDFHVAKFLRQGEEFRAKKRILTEQHKQNTQETTNCQIVSLVIEVTFLLLGVIGINLRLNATQVQRVTNEVIPVVNTTPFRKIAREFVTRVRNASPWEIGRAIYEFVVGWYRLGILHNILNIILSEMSWRERTLVFVRIVALFTAAFASGGAVLVAQFVLAAENFGRMVQKVANMLLLERHEHHGKGK